MVLRVISAFCPQKALDSTGFIRFCGKAGSHVPNAGNANAFLGIPGGIWSRASSHGRAEISKIDWVFLLGICNIGPLSRKSLKMEGGFY